MTQGFRKTFVIPFPHFPRLWVFFAQRRFSFLLDCQHPIQAFQESQHGRAPMVDPIIAGEYLVYITMIPQSEPYFNEITEI